MFKETSISQYFYHVIGIERYFKMKSTFKRQTMTSLLVVTLFFFLIYKIDWQDATNTLTTVYLW